MITKTFIILSIILCSTSVRASQAKKKESSSSSLSKSLTYAKHAQDRMAERNRSTKDVQAAIQVSIPYQSKHNKKRTVHIDPKSGTKVVLNKEKLVVTVIAKKPKFQEHWNAQYDENYKFDTRLSKQFSGRDHVIEEGNE